MEDEQTHGITAGTYVLDEENTDVVTSDNQFVSAMLEAEEAHVGRQDIGKQRKGQLVGVKPNDNLFLRPEDTDFDNERALDEAWLVSVMFSDLSSCMDPFPSILPPPIVPMHHVFFYHDPVTWDSTKSHCCSGSSYILSMRTEASGRSATMRPGRGTAWLCLRCTIK